MAPAMTSGSDPSPPKHPIKASSGWESAQAAVTPHEPPRDKHHQSYFPPMKSDVFAFLTDDSGGPGLVLTPIPGPGGSAAMLWGTEEAFRGGDKRLRY